MTDDLIDRLYEVHRLAMESHNNFMRTISYSRRSRNYYNIPNTNATNMTNLSNSNFSDIFRANLPPITIDLTNLFNSSTNNSLPTEEEIDNACEVISYSDIPENERTTTICPIDRQPFQQNENVLRIRHCKHYFRESNLRQNFQNNSLCPLCRHNIL